MQNLIPTHVYHRLRRVYYLRFGAVVAWLAAGVCGVGALTLLPTLFVVEATNQQLADRRASLQSIAEQRRASSSDAQIDTVQQRLGHFHADRTDPLLLNSLRAVVAALPSNVALESVTYTAGSEDAAASLRIAGVAEDRSAAQAYQRALTNIEQVERVDLPVQQLAQSTNVSFSVTVTGDL